jgi:hypothetical protein
MATTTGPRSNKMKHSGSAQKPARAAALSSQVGKNETKLSSKKK